MAERAVEELLAGGEAADREGVARGQQPSRLLRLRTRKKQEGRKKTNRKMAERRNRGVVASRCGGEPGRCKGSEKRSSRTGALPFEHGMSLPCTPGMSPSCARSSIIIREQPEQKTSILRAAKGIPSRWEEYRAEPRKEARAIREPLASLKQIQKAHLRSRRALLGQVAHGQARVNVAPPLPSARAHRLAIARNTHTSRTPGRRCHRPSPETRNARQGSQEAGV